MYTEPRVLLPTRTPAAASRRWFPPQDVYRQWHRAQCGLAAKEALARPGADAKVDADPLGQFAVVVHRVESSVAEQFQADAVRRSDGARLRTYSGRSEKQQGGHSEQPTRVESLQHDPRKSISIPPTQAPPARYS
jgi:hypothetical protein